MKVMHNLLLFRTGMISTDAVLSTKSKWHRCVRAMLLLILLSMASVSWAQTNALVIYQQAMQAMLDKTVLPKLKETLTADERARISGLTVSVTSSNDPGQVLRLDSSQPLHYLISAGYMSLQDVLVDATIIADMESPHIDELMIYSFDVARYGHAITRSGAFVTAAPSPLWARLNWSEAKYQQLRGTTTYNVIRYRGAEQNLAWLAAVAIAREIASVDPQRKRIASLTSSRDVYELAGDLMLRNNWAPGPSWPVAILYASAMQKNSDQVTPALWACETKQILDAAVAVVQRADSLLSSSAQRTERQQMNEYWQVVATKLAARGQCDVATQRLPQ